LNFDRGYIGTWPVGRTAWGSPGVNSDYLETIGVEICEAKAAECERIAAKMGPEE